MNSMLATEPTSDTPTPSTKSLLESWSTNERMRHIPPLAWMVEKVDVDLRRRIDLLCEPVEVLFADDQQRIGVDRELRAVCTALEHLADVARHGRSAGQPPNELTRQVVWSLNLAAGCIRGLDANLIGRRFPFQTFERSKAEPLYSALLVVLCAVDRLVDAVREIDSEIDGRLDEKLVQLEQPMREDPIALP